MYRDFERQEHVYVTPETKRILYESIGTLVEEVMPNERYKPPYTERYAIYDLTTPEGHHVELGVTRREGYFSPVDAPEVTYLEHGIRVEGLGEERAPVESLVLYQLPTQPERPIWLQVYSYFPDLKKITAIPWIAKIVEINNQAIRESGELPEKAGLVVMVDADYKFPQEASAESAYDPDNPNADRGALSESRASYIAGVLQHIGQQIQ